MTDQIRYMGWGTNSPDHPTYWNDIADIADMIGASLGGAVHGFSKERYAPSTIRVQQTKEKFGDARVYCILADDELVENQWLRSNQPNDPSPVSDEFKTRCLMDDIRHYNKIYTSMIRLVPHYRDAIISGADFPHMLHSTPGDAVESLRRRASGKFSPAWHVKQVTSDLEKYVETFQAMQWDVSLLPPLEELLTLASGFYV